MRADGLILAGGKSARMGGRHKGSLLYKEETFVQILIREMGQEVQQMWISYGQKNHGSYAGCRLLTDIYPECGPIGGIHAGLSACGQEWMLVMACDMPLLKKELFLRLYRELERAGQGEEYEGVVPVTEGRVHPLAALYRKGLAKTLEGQIEDGNFRLRDALKKSRILYVDVSKAPAFTEMLRNINTEEEYRKLV